MGDRISKSLQVLKNVFSRPGYIATALIIALVMVAINIYLPNFRLLFSEIGNPSVLFSLLTSLFIGGFQSLPKHSIITLIIISILTGMAIALIAFKVNTKRKFAVKGKKRAIAGVVFGLLAPACVPCGIGLGSLIGLGGAIAYLPFKGIELGVLAIALLVYSVHTISYSMSECKECRI